MILELDRRRLAVSWGRFLGKDSSEVELIVVVPGGVGQQNSGLGCQKPFYQSKMPRYLSRGIFR